MYTKDNGLVSSSNHLIVMYLNIRYKLWHVEIQYEWDQHASKAQKGLFCEISFVSFIS